jgi:hypothetical protein
VPVADNLPPSKTDVMKSGSLGLPEPSGPHRAVMGMLKCSYVYLLLDFEKLKYRKLPLHIKEPYNCSEKLSRCVES